MSKTSGIILTAGAIAGLNEWIQTNTIPWRIGIADVALVFFMDGVEKLNERIATVLSVAILITALVTPFHGNSPVQEIADFVGVPQGVVPPKGKTPSTNPVTFPVRGPHP